MNEFVVGDKVKVKSYDEIMNLSSQDRGGFVQGMKAYCGKKFKIKEVRNNSYFQSYILSDMPAFIWYGGCLEKI